MRAPPTASDLLEALAAALGAGSTRAEALALLARAGPASARMARQLSGKGTLSQALADQKLIARDEQAVVALAEENGKLPSALRWAAERRQIKRERERAIRQAIASPLVFTLLALALDPLPSLMMGGGSLWLVIRAGLLSCALGAIGFAALPQLLASVMGRLSTQGAEASMAGLIARFAEPNQLALAPRAARAAGAQLQVDALAAVAADPAAAVPSFSEPFALALQVGLRAGDLPERLAAFHRAAEAEWTARLRTIARVVAFTLLAIAALHGVAKLVTTPLGGNLGESPEMKELEKELENLGQ